MKMKKICIAVVLVMFCAGGLVTANAQGGASSENTVDAGPVFLKGADVSILQAVEDGGAVFKEDGKAKDALQIFKDHDFNYIRLRLFHNPDGLLGQVNDLPYTLKLARRCKDMGFKFLLDFHYSDKWADPGHQHTPEAWKDLSHEELTSTVFEYTRDVIGACRVAGCYPDMVQIGNEITPGMMWPDGKLWDSPGTEAERWTRLGDLVKAGLRGVAVASEGHGPITTMIQVDCGGDKGRSQWFFDNLKEQGAQFDVIGLSYYPFWHGTFDDLRVNMKNLIERYDKDVIVVETAYYVGKKSQEEDKLPFPTTAEGQKDFLDALIRVTREASAGRRTGVMYWEPAWAYATGWARPDWSDDVEARALFDKEGNMLPGMRSFDR
jgi:arabinogalactan endo-1,4-beta-galactosidase